MKADAEGEIESTQDEQGSKFFQQQRNQPNLEDVGVKHHQQDDDHVEQDSNVLDSVTRQTGMSEPHVRKWPSIVVGVAAGFHTTPFLCLHVKHLHYKKLSCGRYECPPVWIRSLDY